MKNIACMFLLTALWVLTAQPIFAEDKDPNDLPWDTAYLNLGVFLASTDSGFRIGQNNVGLGIDINVEDFLGMQSTNSAFRIDAGYRFGKSRRHVVDFSWFKFDREAAKTISEPISLPGGGTISGDIQSIFNFDIFRIKYRYSFLLDERIDLNVGLGAFVMPVEFGFGQVGQELTQEAITAPLPVVSLGFDLAITPKWFLKQGGDLFYLDIGDFAGSILNMRVALEYYAWRHVALGVGLESLSIDIESENDNSYPGIDFIGSIEFAYVGAQFYMKFYY